MPQKYPLQEGLAFLLDLNEEIYTKPPHEVVVAPRKKGIPQDAFFTEPKPDQTRLKSGLRTCCASAAEKNFSV